MSSISEEFVKPENEVAVSTISEALSAAAEIIDDVYSENNLSGIYGLETGFSDLDRITAGMQPGDLIVVAGRPGTGKTALSTNIAQRVAMEANKLVVIFSMEMGKAKLATRMAGAVGRISPHAMLTGSLEDEDWLKLTDALGALNNSPIDIIDSLSIGWSAESLEKILMAYVVKPSLVIVDGLQSFDVTNTATAYDRNIQLGEQVRRLKKMALKLNFPVILTASLNRELESRPNKRPILRDLRDIGMLEDISDLVLFIYRDEIYYSDSPDRGMAEVIIGKQRNGPSGMVRLVFVGDYLRFENYVSHLEDEY